MRTNYQHYNNLEDALKLVKHLMREGTEFYNDIHIRAEDSNSFIVEWVQVHYEYESDCGRFEFVDCDQEVMTEFVFPDNHTEMLSSEKEFEDRLKEFLEEDPDWERNECGRWFRRSEQKAWQDYLKQENNK